MDCGGNAGGLSLSITEDGQKEKSAETTLSEKCAYMSNTPMMTIPINKFMLFFLYNTASALFFDGIAEVVRTAAVGKSTGF